MIMLHAIPALPVKNMNSSIDFYQDKLGFKLVHFEAGFAVLECNHIQIHLWEANDESWRSRDNSAPVCSGAESFIAGTASCRIEVEDVDKLYQQIQPLGILHPNTKLSKQWWGVRDFAILDLDNNLINFFEKINVKHRK